MIEDTLTQVFDEAYETTYQRLSLTTEKSEEGLEAVEREFKALCNYDGLGWTGRGDVSQARMDGTISAYQVFIKRFGED